MEAELLLWVTSGSSAATLGCPLYTQQRKSWVEGLLGDGSLFGRDATHGKGRGTGQAQLVKRGMIASTLRRVR